jgi:hypothetical protein
MPMKVKVVDINGTKYIRLPKGWKDLVKTKVQKTISETEVAMEVNTILRVFPITEDNEIIRCTEEI